MVPDIVGIEEADEGRIQFRESATRGARLADVRLELDIVEAPVIQLGKALLDRRIGLISRGVIHDNDMEIAKGLACNRFDGSANIGTVVVIGDDDADGRNSRHYSTESFGSYLERAGSQSDNMQVMDDQLNGQRESPADKGQNWPVIMSRR